MLRFASPRCAPPRRAPPRRAPPHPPAGPTGTRRDAHASTDARSLAVQVVADVANAIIAVIVFLPPVLMLRYLRDKSKLTARSEEREPWDRIIRFFATGFVPAAIITMIVELLLSILFIVLCFQGNMQEGVDIMSGMSGESSGDGESAGAQEPTQSFGLYAFLLLTAFVTAATTEEIAKAMILRFAVCPSKPCCVQEHEERINPRTTLLYLVAGAVGFSTIENILYTWGGTLTQATPFLVVLVQGLVRALVALPTHTLCAGMTAARLVHRDRQLRELPNPRDAPSWLWVLFPAIFVHGTYDAQAMVLSVALDGVVDDVAGLVIILVTSLLMLFLGAWVFWHQWNKYAERSGSDGRRELAEV